MELPSSSRAASQRTDSFQMRETDFAEEEDYEETLNKGISNNQRQSEDEEGFDILDQAEMEDGPSADCMMPETTPASQQGRPQQKKKKGLFSTLTSYVASATKSRSKKHPK